MDETRTSTSPAGERPTLTDGPVLVVVDHPEPDLVGTKHPLDAGHRWNIGRQSADLLPGVFESSRISRRHACIELGPDGFTVADQGSRNGTWLDGRPLTGSSPLMPGTLLEVGPVRLMLITGPPMWEPPRTVGLGGVGPQLARAIGALLRVAPRETPVLLIGETGTGKERFAKLLHERSGLDGQLVTLNCGALSDTLVHSELFGHVRGAFSGAHERRDGLVRAARGGTLFLDEIGDAGPGLQQSLLRLVEAREYRPVGADRTERARCRFVAAAQPALESEVGRGFRADLYNRLSRWVVRLPALRDRPEDILPLARSIADAAAGKPVRFAPEAAAAMVRHRWPGNVRELQSVVERAVVSADDDAARLDALTVDLPRLSATPSRATATPRFQMPATGRRPPTERPDRDALVSLLREHDGSVRALANHLDVPRKTVYRWAAAYDLDLGALRSS